MRGDHLVFLTSSYSAPIPGLRLPLVGQPALRLEHAAGAAWRSGDPRPPLEQNVGVGVQALLFHAVAFVDPAARPVRPRLAIGLRSPAAATLPLF
jgi:hypothetical protein